MSEAPRDEAERRRVENLRAVLAGPPPAPAAPAPGAREDAPRSHRTRNGMLGGLAAGAAVVLGKLKFLGLLAGALKLKTLLTMLLSVALYAHEWGWPFAVGFVLLLFVHEMGHVVALRQEGIPASAPMFIPFLGAFVAMRGMPRNAYVEAKVGIAGPVAGSVAAWATLAAGLALHQPLLVTVAHAAILLNLFNLIPVSPLDGGRIAGAFSRPFWIVGYALGIAAVVFTRSPLLLIVLAVGLFTLWQRWNHPVPGYHDIPRGQRLAMALGYAGLVIGLVLTLPVGMVPHPAAG